MGLAWSNNLSMPVEGASTSPRLPFEVHSFSTYCIISGTFDIFFDSDVLEHIILTPANDTCITVRNSLSNALPETNVVLSGVFGLGSIAFIVFKMGLMFSKQSKARIRKLLRYQSTGSVQISRIFFGTTFRFLH